MSRIFAIAVAALMAWAPSSEASAQDSGPRTDRRGQLQSQQQPRPLPDRPAVTVGEALSIARGRARGARFVGTMAARGDTYVIRFESEDGQIFDISVDARTGRAGGG